MATTRDRLLADHRRLEDLLTLLMDAFAADDAREDIQVLWGALSRSLETHFGLEERTLFPRFQVVEPAETASLLAQHRVLRAQLDELGVGIDLKLVRATVAREFIDGLREHAKIEDALLYRWVEFNAGEAVRSGGSRRTVAAEQPFDR